jgi:hypothetical protein
MSSDKTGCAQGKGAAQPPNPYRVRRGDKVYESRTQARWPYNGQFAPLGADAPRSRFEGQPWLDERWKGGGGEAA